MRTKYKFVFQIFLVRKIVFLLLSKSSEIVFYKDALYFTKTENFKEF
jgi:hypothetical protein